MNHKEVIQTISERSSKSEAICEMVIRSYEKYCERNLTQTSKKHMKAIVEYISNEELIDYLICQAVMESYFDLLEEQIKKKLSFM